MVNFWNSYPKIKTHEPNKKTGRLRNKFQTTSMITPAPLNEFTALGKHCVPSGIL